jgi:ABC-type nitrate/sulfonate/bicarbonate transport system ATPase subunit
MTLATERPARTATPRIDLRGLRKSFAGQEGPVPVLDGLSLSVGDGEFVSILGPSGCGKSTLFSLLMGIEPVDDGTILIDGAPAAREANPFAWMPQRDVLFPWRTVLDNVALGAQVAAGHSRSEARSRAGALLPTFGLDGFARSRPFQLSGGMRQRAALARTVAQERDVLLLDEPFGALDALTRTELQFWLEQIWERERWTVALITHDVREAVLLSDRVYVLSPRPAAVRLELEIPLPRPRTLDTLADPQVAALEHELLTALDVASRARGPAGPLRH